MWILLKYNKNCKVIFYYAINKYSDPITSIILFKTIKSYMISQVYRIHRETNHDNGEDPI